MILSFFIAMKDEDVEIKPILPSLADESYKHLRKGCRHWKGCHRSLPRYRWVLVEFYVFSKEIITVQDIIDVTPEVKEAYFSIGP